MKAIAVEQDARARAEREEALSVEVRRILQAPDWESRLAVLIKIHSVQAREWQLVQKAIYHHLHSGDAVAGAVAIKKRLAQINPRLLLTQRTEQSFAPVRQRQPSPVEFFKKHHGAGHVHSKAVAELAKNYVICGQLEYLIELDRNNPMMHAVINRGIEAGFQQELESRSDLFTQKFRRLSQPGGLPDFLVRLSPDIVQRGLASAN